MTASGVLDHLARHGVELVFCDGEALRCEAPPGFVTPALLAEIRRQKPALVALLTEAPEAEPEPSPEPLAHDALLARDFDMIPFGAEPAGQFLGCRTITPEQLRRAVEELDGLNRAATANR